MKTKRVVSTKAVEVRSNGSISTKKPSTVTMSIDDRFAAEAYMLHLDNKENIERETGLIGFELHAVYEDGKPEPDSPLEKMGEKLDKAMEG